VRGELQISRENARGPCGGFDPLDPCPQGMARRPDERTQAGSKTAPPPPWGRSLEVKLEAHSRCLYSRGIQFLLGHFAALPDEACRPASVRALKVAPTKCTKLACPQARSHQHVDDGVVLLTENGSITAQKLQESLEFALGWSLLCAVAPGGAIELCV